MNESNKLRFFPEKEKSQLQITIALNIFKTHETC